MFKSPSRDPQLGRQLLDVFGSVFVINLPDRADRRREMDAQLALVGLGLDHPAVTLFPAVRPGDRGEWPSIGARGCFMSHLGVLEAARARDLPAILILEDDLDWSQAFLADGAGMLARLAATDWQFVHGGHADGHPGGGQEGGQGGDPGDGIVPAAPETGLEQTHFIGLRGAAIARAGDYLRAMAARPGGDPAGGPMHVDGAYSWFRRDNPDIAAHVFRPAIGVQRASRTDIHDLRWFDRTPVVRPLVAALRRVMNRLGG